MAAFLPLSPISVLYLISALLLGIRGCPLLAVVKESELWGFPCDGVTQRYQILDMSFLYRLPFFEKHSVLNSHNRAISNIANKMLSCTETCTGPQCERDWGQLLSAFCGEQRLHWILVLLLSPLLAPLSPLPFLPSKHSSPPSSPIRLIFPSLSSSLSLMDGLGGSAATIMRV